MSDKVKAIPEGYHSLTPHLIVSDSAAAIEFYKEAFGAEEVMRMPGPDGKTIVHAELNIGDSRLMLVDACGMGAKDPKELGGTTVSVHLYVENADEVFQAALDAGAEPKMPVQDTFWGDRWGSLVDPFGHSWSVATHIEDVAPEDMGKRAEEAFAKMGENCGGE